MGRATFREARKYRNPPIDPDLIVQAAVSCGLKVQQIAGTEVRLSAPLNFWSWGESIEVALGAVQGFALVDITSRCRLPTQFADWGKNRRNVARLFAAIHERLEESPEWEACPFCELCGYLLAGIDSTSCPECGQGFVPSAQTSRSRAPSLAVGFRWVGLVTAIELVLGSGLELLGYPQFAIWQRWGPWGVFRLLAINSVGVLLIVLLERLRIRLSSR